MRRRMREDLEALQNLVTLGESVIGLWWPVAAAFKHMYIQLCYR